MCSRTIPARACYEVSISAVYVDDSSHFLATFDSQRDSEETEQDTGRVGMKMLHAILGGQ